MYVDYKAIADEVALKGYADYEIAFAAMSAEENTEYRALSGSELRIWAAQNADDYATIKAGLDHLSEIAYRLIDDPQSTLSLDDARVRALVDGLSITPAGKQAIYDMASVSRKVWPGLKPGHVQNAIDWRAEGRI